MTAPVLAPVPAPVAPVSPASAASPAPDTLESLTNLPQGSLVPPPEPEESTPPVAESPAPAAIEAAPEGTPEGTEVPAEKVPVFAVEVPHHRPGEPAIPLQVPDQAAADALKHQFNLAAKVPKLETIAQESREARATNALLTDKPEHALFMIHEAHPEAAAKFVKSYFQMHPQEVLDMANQMGLGNRTELEIEQGARLAQRDARDMIEEGKKQYTAATTTDNFSQTAGELVDGVVRDMGLAADHPEAEMFLSAAEKRMLALYARNPHADASVILQTLQPLVQTLAAHIKQAPPTPIRASAPVIPAGQPRAPDGTFANKDALKKTATGTPTMPALQGWAEAGETDTLYDIAGRS